MTFPFFSNNKISPNAFVPGRTDSLAVAGNRFRGRKTSTPNPTRWRAWTRNRVHLGKGIFQNDTHENLRNQKTSVVRRGENRMSTYRCNGNVYIKSCKNTNKTNVTCCPLFCYRWNSLTKYYHSTLSSSYFKPKVTSKANTFPAYVLGA